MIIIKKYKIILILLIVINLLIISIFIYRNMKGDIHSINNISIKELTKSKLILNDKSNLEFSIDEDTSYLIQDYLRNGYTEFDITYDKINKKIYIEPSHDISE